MREAKAKYDAVAAAARRWWLALQPDRKTGQGGDRGALASLRRVVVPEDAAHIPAALVLARAFGITEAVDDRLRHAFAAAAVLAHVRADDPDTHPATRLMPPVMSPLRFARLLQTETAEERIIAFRRAVALAERKLDVGRLAAAVLDWPHRRIEWAFQFHGAAPPEAIETKEDIQA